MKILLTNDDGIDADGLKCLTAAVEGELYTVAPGDHVSECSHRITTRQPLRVEQRDERAWAVYGSPADCVRVAIKHLYPNVAFDWVLSGVNEGGNLGVDLYYSGTVAAVREAALFGFKGIAFSHYLKRRLPVDWEQAAKRVQKVWAGLLKESQEAGHFWNVNLPHLDAQASEPSIRTCEPCKFPLPVSFSEGPEGVIYTGRYPSRERRAGSDTDLCFGGEITVSKIPL